MNKLLRLDNLFGEEPGTIDHTRTFSQKQLAMIGLDEASKEQMHTKLRSAYNKYGGNVSYVGRNLIERDVTPLNNVFSIIDAVTENVPNLNGMTILYLEPGPYSGIPGKIAMTYFAEKGARVVNLDSIASDTPEKARKLIESQGGKTIIGRWECLDTHLKEHGIDQVDIAVTYFLPPHPYNWYTPVRNVAGDIILSKSLNQAEFERRAGQSLFDALGQDGIYIDDNSDYSLSKSFMPGCNYYEFIGEKSQPLVKIFQKQ